MLRREKIRRGYSPKTAKLTLGQAVSDIVLIIGREEGVCISGKKAICVVNRRKRQTLYYNEEVPDDGGDFLRLWCFARVVQVLLHLRRGWCTDASTVRETVRRSAFGRHIPAAPTEKFAKTDELIAYCIQWMLGREIPELKAGLGRTLAAVCFALEREIDHGEPLEETLAFLAMV